MEINNCDFFVHTWFNGNSEKFTTSQPGQDGRVGEESPETKEIIGELKPVKFEIEKQIDFAPFVKDFIAHPEGRQEHIMSMFYSMTRATRMAVSHADYDVIVRARIDLIYSSDFIIPSIPKKTVYAPAKWQDERTEYTANDCLNVCDQDGAKVIMSIYSNMHKLNKLIAPVTLGENYIGYAIKESQFKVLSYPIDVEIAQRVHWSKNS
jgi:hypothetical protein